MKAIAVLTMAFLPGTFVAVRIRYHPNYSNFVRRAKFQQAFFAMPLFNWNASAHESVYNPRFWRYWTVTIPLTVLVFLLWGVWVRWSMALHKKQDVEARVSIMKPFRLEKDDLGVLRVVRN
jgi:hypothetical protein